MVGDREFARVFGTADRLVLLEAVDDSTLRCLEDATYF